MYVMIACFLLCVDVNFQSQPRDKGVLFYTRHSTHNSDILTVLVCCWQVTGRVTRALFHRLLVEGAPWIRYIGGVAGQRSSAVALLRSNFWCGVIPGGAEEAMKGHENCYRVLWPANRTGFAKVAKESEAMIVPFFVRNSEESRFNPVIDVWHLIKGYKLYDAIVAANIPILTPLVHYLAPVVWFFITYIQIPIPVRCTLIFGEAVPYDRDEDTQMLVDRCHTRLQSLIDEHQPNSKQGRNYSRALRERWNQEWTSEYPKITNIIQQITPTIIKKIINDWADSGEIKKRK